MIDMNDPEVIESLKYLIVPKEEKIKTSARPFDSKKNFFVPHKVEGYLTSEIQSEDGDDVTVVNSLNETVTVKRDQLLQMNPPKYEKCDDMADLTYLNDATVYHNLRERYTSWYIYTYSGLFCVTINPFKRLPLYTMKMVDFYRGKKKNEVPPHLYLVADNAYSCMSRDRANQSMLITGESGAGKTENTKKVIQYFAFVAANVGGKKKQAEDANKPSLEDQIVSANPVLEAYGNAKTTRNNNSSRFGKFIRIHFTANFGIAGADIESYLLEKSRITYCMELERNYHIFYQLCSGGIPELTKDILLEADASKYFFINQGMLTIDRVDDKQEMIDTKKAFDVLMFTQEQQMDLFKITAAVAIWGNSQWKQRPREEQAEPDGTEELAKVATLLGIDENDLIKGITKPRIKVGNEYVNKGQNRDQCINSVGALSKAAFSRAFTWLVEVVNVTLDVKELKRAHFIGVLDIAGFETFEYNGFEQICINFTNECLQQFFNNFMFVLEQEEYKKEGIVWETQSFGADLQATIDLIGQKMGIFAILEEQCIVPKATDQTFKEALYKQHHGKHPSFAKSKPRKGARFEAHFDLHHYAGVVQYSVDGWLEKNKDPINMTVAALFKNSKGNNLLNYLFRDVGVEEGGAGKKKGGGSQQTISSGHREQLNKLMKTLDATHPHFVRCIIPNEIKTGGILDAHLVMHQLHCNGVLEGIRICRKGYPSRLLFNEFLARYGILAAEACKSESDPKKASAAVLEHIKLDTEQYRVGLTKVLFKAGILGYLEELRDEIIVRILTLLQSQMRRYLVKKNIKNMLAQKQALAVIQRNAKAYLTLKNWMWFQLFGNIKPLLNNAAKEEEARLKAEQEAAEAAERARIEAEEAAAKAAAEAEAAQKQKEEAEKIAKQFKELEQKNSVLEAENSKIKDEVNNLSQAKATLESQVKDLSESLTNETEKASELATRGKKLEDDINNLSKEAADLQSKLSRSLSEGMSKDTQISGLKSEVDSLNDANGALNQEKKRLQDQVTNASDSLAELQNTLKNVEDSKKRVEDALQSAEDQVASERRDKTQLESIKRKLESSLTIAQSNIEKFETICADQEAVIKRKESDLSRQSNELNEERENVSNVQKKVKQLQYHLTEAEEVISEQKSLKARAEKHAEELTHEIKELLAEVDQSSAAEVRSAELKKKAEQELNNLRREMIENNKRNDLVQAQMKKKHDEAVADLSRQIETLIKAKSKLEKERLALIAGNDKAREPVGFLDKDELFQIEMSKQSVLRARYNKD